MDNVTKRARQLGHTVSHLNTFMDLREVNKPTQPKEDSIWFDTSTNFWYRFTKGEWVRDLVLEGWDG